MDWSDLDKVVIFKGHDENGNRYLSQFLRDYKEVFNSDLINASCDRCLEDYYLKFTKHLYTMSDKKKSNYVLKKKYNGIPLEFGSAIQVSNTNMTDEYGEKLLKDHAKGADLFDQVPDAKIEDVNDDLKKLDRSGLDEVAASLGLEPKNYSNKELVTAAIIEARLKAIEVAPE